jgi:hypothetical protein
MFEPTKFSDSRLESFFFIFHQIDIQMNFHKLVLTVDFAWKDFIKIVFFTLDQQFYHDIIYFSIPPCALKH